MKDRLGAAAGGPTLTDLSAADLQALRLAVQVLRHKSALSRRPAVERYCANLGRLVDFELARRGIGFVIGQPPVVRLDEAADDEDRRQLADHLGLLADNERLPAPVRDLCDRLREEVGR